MFYKGKFVEYHSIYEVKDKNHMYKKSITTTNYDNWFMLLISVFTSFFDSED